MNNDVLAPERYQCPNDVYQADEGRSVGNSGLSVFLKSPELYDALFVSRTIEPPVKATTDYGNAVHDAVLCGGGFSALCMRIPANVLAKNGARNGKAWDEFEAANADKVLLKDSEYDAIRVLYDSILKHPKARAILEADGPVENNWRWYDDACGLWRRARLDKFTGYVIGDIKTCLNVHPQAFVKSVVTYGYYRQSAYYQDAIEAETGERPPVVFIAVEKRPPYRTRCYDLTDTFVDLGSHEIAAGLQRLADCKRTGCWETPDGSQIVTLGEPGWIANRELWELPADE